MDLIEKKGSTFSASLLIAAWCLGGGFYGLPIASGTSGFWPGMLLNVVVFLFMLIASLLYIEAILALPDGNNFISLCKKLIGPLSATIFAIFFFIIHYSYMAYYFHDIIPVLADFLQNSLSQPLVALILVTLLILVVTAGVWITSRLTLALFLGLAITTIWFFIVQVQAISTELLERNQWIFLFLALPTYIGVFYYQSLLPTLSTYLGRDHKKICKSIFFGSFIVFSFNSIWQLLIIGTTPESKLWKAVTSITYAQQGIKLFVGTPFLTHLYHFITFFSIITSLLLGGLLLVDVISDGCKIPLVQRRGVKRLLCAAAVFVPALLLSPFDWVLAEDIFTGWAELFFVGALPIWLVWQVRYTHKLQAPKLLPGGRYTLILFGILNFLLYYVQGATILWSETT